MTGEDKAAETRRFCQNISVYARNETVCSTTSCVSNRKIQSGSLRPFGACRYLYL
jgi:hypothetical protein